MSLSEIMFSVFETLHDEHIIAVREEPILHLVFYQTEYVNLFEEFKTAFANAQNLSNSLKVNEFLAFDNQ